MTYKQISEVLAALHNRIENSIMGLPSYAMPCTACQMQGNGVSPALQKKTVEVREQQKTLMSLTRTEAYQLSCAPGRYHHCWARCGCQACCHQCCAAWGCAE